MSAPSLLIELHYLPCIAYFACLLPYEVIYIEAHENYQKQTYRNRCYIRTSQKVDRLSVPVIQGTKKQLYTDIKIDYSQPWIDQQWRTLCTAYGKAPYFEYLAPVLYDCLNAHPTHLFELNLSLLKLCLQILGIQKEIKMTDRYSTQPYPTIQDLRNTLNPTQRLREPIYYTSFSYQQVFGTIFSPNLSIIDLLFCEGPHAYYLFNKHDINHTKNC